MVASKLRKKELIEVAKKHASSKGIDILNMKQKSDTLSLLIDAFMNDPLVEYVTGIKEPQEQNEEKYKKLMMQFMYDWVNIDMLKEKNGIALGVKENDELLGVVSIVASDHDKKEGFFTILRKVIQIGIPPNETTEGKKFFHPLTSKRMNQLDDVLSRRLE